MNIVIGEEDKVTYEFRPIRKKQLTAHVNIQSQKGLNRLPTGSQRPHDSPDDYTQKIFQQKMKKRKYTP